MATKVPKVKPVKAVRLDGYKRNMAILHAFKETHACQKCGQKYPHEMMVFEQPANGGWSISKLAGSRCKVEDLQTAMEKTPLYCIVCRRRQNRAK